MRIVAVETFRLGAFPNLLWVRLTTDAGVAGLGETYFGAGAVEAHIHETLAARLIGRDPLQIEALNRDLSALPLAQASTGAESRAVSAIDVALWDIFGKGCGQPVHQMLGGLCHERLPIYNTCAGSAYTRGPELRPVANWALGQGGEEGAGKGAGQPRGHDDLDAFMNRADQLAEDLLETGISAMKIWPFDPAARESGGRSISNAQLKRALEPFEKIRKAVGDRMDIMVEFHSLWNLPTAKQIARALEPYAPRWYEDPIRMTSPQALADYARATPVWVCASETLGSRFPYKELLERDAVDVVMADLVWTGGLTEGRKIAALADTWHRPFAPHDCTGPLAFVAAVHAAFSQPNTLIMESVRAFYTGWYRELVTALPRIEGGQVYPMEGPGLGSELLPQVFERSDLTVRRSGA